MHSDHRQTVYFEDLLVPAIGGLLAFLVYLATLAPDITWANFGSDGGELITAAMTWGIPHPPGYPTYVLLGRVAGSLPLGPVAWRFNLFSAAAAAVTVAFTTATARDLLSHSRFRDLASLAAGLTIAFTPLVWGQAIITEVYALNMAVLAIFLWSLLTNQSPLLSGLLLGLGVTTHLSSLLLIPLALALTTRDQWRRLLPAMALGLLPLLFLPLFGRSNSPVIWGDPTTISGWWWLVSGRIYHANIGIPDSDSLLTHTAAFGRTIPLQLAGIGWLVIALGLAARIVSRRTTIWLLISSALYLVYAFLYRTDDAVVNLLPLFILLSPLLAAGLSKLGYLSPLLPLLLFALNLRTSNLNNDRFVRPLAAQVLETAPQDAILLTSGDQSIFSLWYFHHIEGARNDLILVDANLFAFDWYRDQLSEQYGELVALEEDNIPRFIAANSRLRPVCEVAPELGGLPDCLDDS